MLKGALLGLIVVALSVGVVMAGEQKGLMEKVTSPVKKLIPSKSEQAGAQKEGESVLEKMKKALPGKKEQAGAQKEGEGMMQKVTQPFKKIIPGGKEK